MEERQNGSASVETSVKRPDGSINNLNTENEILDVLQLQEGEECARVSLSLGGTFNIGNYESCRTDLHISVPCRVTQIDQTIDWVKNKLEQRLEQEVVDAKNFIAGK